MVAHFTIKRVVDYNREAKAETSVAAVGIVNTLLKVNSNHED